MKDTLEEILGSLEPDELDELMPGEFESKLPFGALSRIESMALKKAGVKNKRTGRFRRRIFIPAAACLTLAVCFSIAACAAETKEYNTAVDFFVKNGLSVDGLSRSEMKAVYRDITTQSFANDKTIEVIRNSVPGVEIFQQDPTPQQLAEFWNNNGVWNSRLKSDGIYYQTNFTFKTDEELGFDVIDKSFVECYSGGKAIWTAEFSDLFVEKSVLTSSGTAVWGHTEFYSGEQPVYSRLARVDGSGKTLWESQLDHGFHHEYIAAVLDNGDGTWAVISRGDNEYLCLSQYDMNGTEIGCCKTQIGSQGIQNAARLGDGYLVQLRSYSDDKRSCIAKLDKDGNIIDNFIYESDDFDYYITDMTEFENRVYLSAYAVPKQTDEGGRHEIANILKYVYSKPEFTIPGEELTPIVRKNYTAVLLLCDPDGGKPESFYSVSGSLGGTLTAEANQLKWNVGSVISTYYSPLTSSFTIGIGCRVYQYTFDSSGVLTQCIDTGENTNYAI